MTADVYAGDDDLNRVGPAAADPILTIIRVLSVSSAFAVTIKTAAETSRDVCNRKGWAT